MTRFFSISDNSFNVRGFPWVQEIFRGLELVKICYTCVREGRRIERPRGELEVSLERGKGNRWPDILGCGAWPLFIVSGRVLDAWDKAGISDILRYPLKIAEPLPVRLRSICPPEYVWLDGEQMLGGELDFDASGFVGVSFCPECHTPIYEIAATYDRQHATKMPLTIIEESWNGKDLFTTNLSPTAFFCTEKVLDCANANKHSNFRFIPSEVAVHHRFH